MDKRPVSAANLRCRAGCPGERAPRPRWCAPAPACILTLPFMAKKAEEDPAPPAAERDAKATEEEQLEAVTRLKGIADLGFGRIGTGLQEQLKAIGADRDVLDRVMQPRANSQVPPAHVIRPLPPPRDCQLEALTQLVAIERRQLDRMADLEVESARTRHSAFLWNRWFPGIFVLTLIAVVVGLLATVYGWRL